MSNSPAVVTLTQERDYRFIIRFAAGMPELIGDEPPPLGGSTGPSPVQLLCAAVGNCLADSLLFAFRKFKQAPDPLRCSVQAEVGRNAEGQVRVLGMVADLHLGVPAAQLEHVERVLGQFENFCTVTRSVAGGIPVQTRVFDSLGALLKS